MERFTVEVRTPSRLHFGLMELSANQPHRYAGLGVMLDEPGFHIKAICSPRLSSSGAPEIRATTTEVRDRIARLISHWSATNHLSSSLVQVNVLEELPLHSGLGSGTQLACAVVSIVEISRRIESDWNSGSHAGSQQMWTPIHEVLSCWDAALLAARAGRGLRSAIGAQGFLSGGLILDLGAKGEQAWRGDERVDVQTSHVNLPSSWRVVLLRPPSAQCLDRVSGEREVELLNQIASRPNPNRQAMLELAEHIFRLVTSGADFDEFVFALSSYLDFAAEMFVPIQGGRYNGEACAGLARAAEQAGLRAVGQSSWGPTIFGWSRTVDEAEQVVRAVQSLAPGSTAHILRPAADGATFRYTMLDH